MNKLYIYGVLGVALMGLSWYAFSATKALGAAELKNKELVFSLEALETSMELLNTAFQKNRQAHETVERNLRRRIGELHRVKIQPCFDDPIPDPATRILQQLPGLTRMPETVASPAGADAAPGVPGAGNSTRAGTVGE
jgi:hypothetical protein